MATGTTGIYTTHSTYKGRGQHLAWSDGRLLAEAGTEMALHAELRDAMGVDLDGVLHITAYIDGTCVKTWDA